jgi:predicted SAM-dependent methyltransferase
MKLNIGAGTTHIEGFVPVDIKAGTDAAKLPYTDASASVIRASHVLEHFPHGQVLDVLKEWVRVLEPGGILKIAVPNFFIISQAYAAGEQINIQGYVMGGQTDADDFHKCIFDAEALTEVMQQAGLVNIEPWASEIQDCASMAISLNLQGTKPGTIQSARPLKVGAVMSVPRVGWMDTFFSVFQSLQGLCIPVIRSMGVYWGQCLTRSFEQYLDEAPQLEAILTVDYDSIFTKADVQALMDLMASHPEAAVIAPMQAGRQVIAPLLSMTNADGSSQREVARETFDNELVEINSAHFGLTLIRTSALRQIPKPWFCETPDASGSWGEGRTDADIHFWKQLKAADLRAFVAPRVVIGHIETVVSWPDANLEKTMQDSAQYFAVGKPENVWR